MSSVCIVRVGTFLKVQPLVQPKPYMACAFCKARLSTPYCPQHGLPSTEQVEVDTALMELVVDDHKWPDWQCADYSLKGLPYVTLWCSKPGFGVKFSTNLDPSRSVTMPQLADIGYIAHGLASKFKVEAFQGVVTRWE